MKALIALNPAIPGNYSFVCPVAPLCLNLINRSGYTTVVSPSILRGLKGRTLIDVNGMIDLETGQFKSASSTTVAEATEVAPEEIKEDKKEAQVTEVKETKAKGKGKAKSEVK